MKRTPSILLALAAVAVTVLAVGYERRPSPPGPSTWGDVLAEADAGGYRIISTEELAERHRRDASSMLLVDNRQEWEFRTGHIEGARNFPMEPNWWSRWRKAVALEAFLGPDKERILIFY